MAELSPLFTWRSAIASEESDLTATEMHVLLVLSLYMNEAGSSCFPGVATLAKRCHRDEATVRRALKEAERKGWLNIKRTIGGNRGRTNSYRATFPDWYAEQLGRGAPHTPSGDGGGAGDPSRGCDTHPEDVKDFDKERKAVDHEKSQAADLVVAGQRAEEAGQREAAEAYIERHAFHYAEDPISFADELKRFGPFSDETIDELRARGLEILRAAEARDEAA